MNIYPAFTDYRMWRGYILIQIISTTLYTDIYHLNNEYKVYCKSQDLENPLEFVGGDTLEQYNA